MAYSVVADVRFWKFDGEVLRFHHKRSTKLLRWTVDLGAQAFNNTYLNYTAPADTEAFDSHF